MRKLLIEDIARQVMEADAEEAYPFECCGFIYGDDNGNERVIREAVPVENEAEELKERRFAITPEEYMKAEQYALDNDSTLLGVYHSHPDHPAVPSEHDRRQALPFFSYIILSVKRKKVLNTTSWESKGSVFEEEQIKYSADKILDQIFKDDK